MRAFFDVNALLAIFDRDHMFHPVARAWWAANARSGWATCPLTQNGFLRVMSQRSYPGHRPFREALQVLAAGVNESGHEFWPDDASIVDPSIFDHTRILGHRQLTDIYLLALATKHGGRLVTFDRTIPRAAVRHAKPENLVVL
ncbi:MAG: PIN domain-containing protein [Bauldia sp.]|nr:PIN domain-containing protein [Bauldia sp.]